MWDSLGVLALKAYAGVLRARGGLTQLVRSAPVPHPAGYAVGSAFVPVDGLELHRPHVRDWVDRLATRLRALGSGVRALVAVVRTRLAERRATREELARSLPDDRHLLRVPVNEPRGPLPATVLRLVVTLVLGSVAVSAVVVLVGVAAVRTLDAFLR